MLSLLSIRKTLISVFDKTKILIFAKSLYQKGIQILSTEGTAQTLSKSGILVRKISDYTNCPEIIDGRIKTLHYKIYAGILNKINNNILYNDNAIAEPIDMVVIDVYPFNSISTNTKHSIEEIIEYIDIGGPSMIRAAAKNYKNTVVIVDNHDYDNILKEMNKYNGSITLDTRFTLATKAFKYIAKYDAIIANYFNNQSRQYTTHYQSIKKTDKNDAISPDNFHFPHSIKCMNLKFIKKQNMRYGENPHQKSALYTEINNQKPIESVATAQQLQGKPLSYNNILDMDTALECVKMFDKPTCVIVKHTNPCGVATSDNINSAYHKAYQADPISAFGGIIAFNKPLDTATSQSIIQQNFVEGIIAPNIHQNCLKILSQKKHIRVLSTGMWNQQHINTLNIDIKRIHGGLLIQDHDIIKTPKHLKIVTHTHPTTKEMQDSLFCWKIVKFIKSNGIVCGKNSQTTGIGTGQLNRVHAVKIATSFIKENQKDTIRIQGSVMASDAFFPFSDSIDIAAKIGIRCIIQPGGSIKDPEIIQTANQYGISMIFTGTRHFRH